MADLLKTEKNLRANHFKVEVFQTREDALKYLKKHVKGTVGVGGSVTLSQMGVFEWLREDPEIHFYDRFNDIDPKQQLHNALNADCFLMSSNAVTEDGMLYNVDGTGNRVSALTFGPKKVFVVVGRNKIVKNLEEAIDRVERIAAVKNCIRLKKNAPCVKTGHCMHCNFDDTICSSFVLTRRSHIKQRIEVLIVKEDLGY